MAKLQISETIMSKSMLLQQLVAISKNFLKVKVFRKVKTKPIHNAEILYIYTDRKSVAFEIEHLTFDTDILHAIFYILHSTFYNRHRVKWMTLDTV